MYKKITADSFQQVLHNHQESNLYTKNMLFGKDAASEKGKYIQKEKQHLRHDYHNCQISQRNGNVTQQVAYLQTTCSSKDLTSVVLTTKDIRERKQYKRACFLRKHFISMESCFGKMRKTRERKEQYLKIT